jgi:ribonuclease BN (tRNA processing enzyme)
MKMTFFGAGDMFSFNQGHNSVLLEFDDTNLIIDFPESNFNSLFKMGKKITDIENIFITHLHEDHINGLQLLGNYFRVYSKRKPVLIFASELYDELWQTLRTGMEPTTAGKKSLEDYFDIKMVDQNFELGNKTFQIIKTKHVPDMSTHGILVEPYFYFSGDTSFDNHFLVTHQEKVAYIFHECHLQNETLKSHTSLEELLSLPESLRNKIVLMHYEDKYSDESERIELELKTGFKIANALSVYNF